MCFLSSLPRSMWPMRMRFSSARSCVVWKIHQIPALILTGVYLHPALLVGYPSWTSHMANMNLLCCRVTIQCTYPLAGLYRLFSVYRFESDTAGVGHIVHSARTAEGRWFNGPTTWTHVTWHVACWLTVWPLYSRSTESHHQAHYSASNSSVHYQTHQKTHLHTTRVLCSCSAHQSIQLSKESLKERSVLNQLKTWSHLTARFSKLVILVTGAKGSSQVKVNTWGMWHFNECK